MVFLALPSPPLKAGVSNLQTMSQMRHMHPGSAKAKNVAIGRNTSCGVIKFDTHALKCEVLRPKMILNSGLNDWFVVYE